MARAVTRTWTAAELADIFQVCRQTIYRWVHRGVLAHPLTIAGVSRWRDEDVQLLLARPGRLRKPRRRQKAQ